MLAGWGLSWVLGRAKISLPMRQWLKAQGAPLSDYLLSLLECAGCTGFWIGLAMGVVNDGFAHPDLLLIFAFAQSGLNALILSYYDHIIIYTEYQATELHWLNEVKTADEAAEANSKIRLPPPVPDDNEVERVLLKQDEIN